jgi:YD repeat-containing protein
MHKKLFISFVGLILAVAVSAKDDAGLYTSPLTGSTLVNGALTNWIEIPYYNDPSIIAQEHLITSVVSLEVIEKPDNFFIPSDFSVDVPVRIHYVSVTGVSAYVDQVLSVNYKKAANEKFKAKDYFTVKGLKKLRIEITGAPDYHGATWNVNDVLIIKGLLKAKRDYVFSTSSVVSDFSAPAPNGQSNQMPDEALIEWNDQIPLGWTHFDVEWSWLDKESIASYYKDDNPNVLDPQKVFRNNATRVSIEVPRKDYSIPLMYDGEGYLVYRVRPWNLKENGDITYGLWSSPDDGSINLNSLTVFSFSGHHWNLNWQSSTTYAEEGKRKTVVTYFDGSLRGRQTVTKDNETGNTIVAETFYDYQGRPVIQVLPAPTLNTVIEYAKNFNQFTDASGQAYPKDLYDLLQPNEELCVKGAPKLKTTSGASKYYSPYSSEVNDQFGKFIPDANGFPYSETRYTPDNTGRVAVQGGVGPEHRLGGNPDIVNAADHSTKYFYGSVDQVELDALFGTEVGDASHYFKNMVRDANGQYSVSYVDMHGRTIATALAGTPPANLKPLDSYTNNTFPEITRNLLTSNLVKGRSIESSKTLLVPVQSNYSFKYELQPEELKLFNCNNVAEICYDCLYDLEITITNTCGTFLQTYTKTNISIPAPNSTEKFEWNFSVSLPEGEYDITKKLIISDAGFAAQKAKFIENNTCKTLNQFLEEAYSIMTSQNSNCQLNCGAPCSTAIGTYQQFETSFLNQAGITTGVTTELYATIQAAYNQAIKDCEERCKPSFNKLKQIRQSMLDDVTPFTGQYATNGPNTYNIFTNIKSGGVDYSTAYRRTNSYYTLADAPDPVTFAQNFKDEWANALLLYHPEYCKLTKAETLLKTSYDRDDLMEATEAFSEALSRNYINASIVNNDPFFQVAGATIKNEMLNLVNADYKQSGLSMWQVAYMAVFCRNQSDGASCIAGIGKTPPYVVNNCTEDWNYFWRIFRAMYLSEKDRLVNQYLDNVCGDPKVTELRGVFRLHFDGYGQFAEPPFDNLLNQALVGNDPNNTQSNINAALETSYDQNCESYKERWKTVLLSCPQINSISEPLQTQVIDEILNGFLDVCKTASNATHPLGASDEPGGTSFEKVMRDVFSVHSLTLDELCNPYLIDWPRPYDKQPAMGNAEIVEPKTECICQKLDGIIAKKNEIAFEGTLSEFIQYQYGTYVRQGMLDTLMMGCNNVYPCNFLKEPISLPPILQCNTPAEVCISCTEYSSLKEEFCQLYPGSCGAPYENHGGDPSKVSANNLFTQFLNYRTGFTKTWMDYLAFQKACESYFSGNAYDCVQLEKLVQLFNQGSFGNTFGASCQQAFVQFFNSFFGTFFTWQEIRHVYLTNCGKLPDVCKPKITCESFNQVITLFYQQYGNQAAGSSNCRETFAAFFNNYYGTAYAWEELVQMFNTLCGRDLDVCSAVNCYFLQAALNSYYATYGSNTWMFSDCREMFRSFINQYFSSNYTWDEIAALYETCGILLTICTPNYACSDLQRIRDQYLNGYDCGSHEENETLRCQECFTELFNTTLSTNYSFVQIAALYKLICGTELEVCEDIIDCERLTSIYEDFRDYYANGYGNASCKDLFVLFFNERVEPHNYTYDQIISFYLYYCGRLPEFCESIDITSCEQIQQVLNDFLALHPDPLTELGTGCEEAFKNFFNQVFGTNYQYFEIVAYYQNLCGSTLTICSESRCGTLQSIYDSYINNYSGYSVPQLLCRDFFVYYFNTQYGATFPLSWQDIQQLYQNCGISLNICPPDNGPVLSCTRMQGLIEIYNTFYPTLNEGENCRTKFARFFNRFYGTLWTYDQIKAYMSSQCSMNLDAYFPCNDDQGRPVVLNPELEIEPEEGLVRPPRLCGLNMPVFPPVEPVKDDPCKDYLDFVFYSAINQYEIYKQELKDEFETKYLQKCLGAKNIEKFTVTNQVSEYHYTLYYYDQAGNLVKTVPPQGVKADFSTSWTDQVALKRNQNIAWPAPHVMVTQYRYNALNQVKKQSKPDAGQNEFWYDRLGRLVVSQNAKQKKLNRFSYTLYDILGRKTEVGEKQKVTGDEMTQSISQDPSQLYAWLTDVNVRREITRTVYDDAYAALCNGGTNSPGNVLCQENLRNRISYTMVVNSETGAPPSVTIGGWSSATFYTYDVHGNVGELLQDYRTGSMSVNNEYKRFKYRYDLISGKVNEFWYQDGQPDAFYHRYTHDWENKLISVKTSSDYVIWDNEASYQYYKHGPLARAVIGENQVQGIDYAYTLHGWFKGVNATTGNEGNEDMGGDGANNMANKNVARDAFGFSLNYYNGDYISIASQLPFADILNPLSTDANHIFNGNIAAIAVYIPKLGESKVYNYGYDQLNRLISMDAYEGIASTNDFTPVLLNAYKERISYDANGNILSYLRNGTGSQPDMDNLDYHYYYQSTEIINNERVWKTYKPGQSANSAPADLFAYSNRLAHVNDNPLFSDNYPTEDIDDQGDKNYEYDEIGNLVKDTKGEVANIEWSSFGKIKAITKTDGTVISYDYDIEGNRIGKTVNGKETWYIRDLNGNVLSVYEKEAGQSLIQTEVHIYGSAKIGILKRNISLDEVVDYSVFVNGASDNKGYHYSLNRGNKSYQLVNHLGNILVSVSDRVLQRQYAGNGSIYYEADVTSASDYAPFGMQLVGRTFSVGTYRYVLMERRTTMRFMETEISRIMECESMIRDLVDL